MTLADPRIIVALDFAEQTAALELVEKLSPAACRLKVGKEMFTRFGADFITELHARKFDVFLDLKFHDIPTTVAKAVTAAADMGVWMVNVHAAGGRQMMIAARNALDSFGDDKPRLIAVTVLTSMSQQELTETGVGDSLENQVTRLAALAKDSGMDGVVCSAREASTLRRQFGEEFQLVTPGIRPASSTADDQHRIVTPADAISAGSHYLVIGRPITKSSDPLKTLCEISESANGVLAKP